MHMTLCSKRANLLMESPASGSSPASNATINDLPCEMFLKVFSYLNLDQLLNTIPQVCTRWETLHSDPSLYRSFNFTADVPSTDEVLKLLRTAPWLKSLNVVCRNDTNAILDCVRISNQRLETLILQYCKGSPFSEAVSSESMLGVLENCNLLQRLSLYGSYCQGTKVYNEIGLRLPSLRSVHLGKPKSFDSQALVNIADNCRNLEEIQAVDFETYDWENAHSITDHIVSSLSNRSKYLKIVEIDFHSCTDASMTTLAKCQHLTTLLLHMAGNITDVGIMAISDMPNIVKLSVRGNYVISKPGWLAFLQRPIMRRLQELSLFWCTNVDQEVMNVIVNNPYDLRELRLTNNSGLGFTMSFNPGHH